MSEIRMDEWLAEIERLKATPSQKKDVPPEADELIRAARKRGIGYHRISKFLRSKGFNLGRHAVTRRCEELGV